jgi:hypothetical protein
MAGEVDLRYITVKKLVEILTELPPEWLVMPNSITQGLSVFESVVPEKLQGAISILFESYESFTEDDEE